MNNLILSPSPHIHTRQSTQVIMRDVLIALCPALIAGIVIFGVRALIVTLVCVVFSVGGEWTFEKCTKRAVTVGDLSAVVTGVLLTFNLPVSIPLWQAAFGSLIAIVGVKQLFGGIGQNFANPAITARIVMFLAFSQSMTTWTFPDAVSSATPLELMKTGVTDNMPSYLDMFLGKTGGCIGETCALAILIGFVYLLIRRVISWQTPVVFVGTVFVMSLILGQDALAQILSGGLMLGAVFMATDYATTPRNAWGKVIFGLGCGLITVLIRFWGSYPEGVSFSILLMNILTPYIDRWTRKKPLGGVKA